MAIGVVQMKSNWLVDRSAAVADPAVDENAGTVASAAGQPAFGLAVTVPIVHVLTEGQTFAKPIDPRHGVPFPWRDPPTQS